MLNYQENDSRSGGNDGDKSEFTVQNIQKQVRLHLIRERYKKHAFESDREWNAAYIKANDALETIRNFVGVRLTNYIFQNDSLLVFCCAQSLLKFDMYELEKKYKIQEKKISNLKELFNRVLLQFSNTKPTRSVFIIEGVIGCMQETIDSFANKFPVIGILGDDENYTTKPIPENNEEYLIKEKVKSGIVILGSELELVIRKGCSEESINNFVQQVSDFYYSVMENNS